MVTRLTKLAQCGDQVARQLAHPPIFQHNPAPMKRANRFVRLIVALSFVCLVAPRFASGQEKPGAKKRPHADSRTPFLHRIPLRDDFDLVIQPPKPGADEKNAKPIKLASITNTCGKCHDYPIISSGWHFNAGTGNAPIGRAGEPWILTDDSVVEDLKFGQCNTRTQIPLSYRDWPNVWNPREVGINDWKMAYAFGRQMPGGGVVETSKDQRFGVTGNLQNDCLICHLADNSYDGNARYEQIVKKQNFKYATLVAAGIGSAEKSRERLKDNWTPPDPNNPNAEGPPEPKFDYDLYRFDPQGHVQLNVTRRVPNERCYFCHTAIDTGKSQANGLRQRWRHDGDIHLVKGMLCVDCHRNGLDHAITRNYEGEAKERNDPSIATLTCQGCHYGSGKKDATGTDLGGRNAAPRPQHKGMPAIHFEKISCTTCHSGPYPSEQATSVLTSMAHRLGTESFNRVDDASPAIQQPVFERSPETGKITPYRVLYPTFWARLNGNDVFPIAPDVLNGSSALRKLFGPKPDNDLQALKPLTDEQVFKALALIADMEPPAPKTAEKPAATQPTTAPSTASWYTGEPIFITGGKAYKRGSNGKLTEMDKDSIASQAAQPYRWALAHDVRGAQEALGARGCTDCHASGTPIFDSKVSTVSLLTGASGTTDMKTLRNEPLGALEALATTYPQRPLLIWTGFICAILLALVLIAYAARAISTIGYRRRTEP